MSTGEDSSDPEEFVTKFADFWSSPSPQRLAELLHPGVVLVQPLADPMMGIGAAQAEFQRFCSGLRAQVDRWCGDGDLVVIEFRLQARIGGAVIEWPNVDRLLLHDGNAIERATYFIRSPSWRHFCGIRRWGGDDGASAQHRPFGRNR